MDMNMELESLKLVLNSSYYDDDKDDDIILKNIYQISLIEKEENNEIINVLCTINNKYDVCLKTDYSSEEIFISELEEDFCINFDIILKEKRIGGICLSRIFVDEPLKVGVFVDNECPNSMEISSQICKKDLELCLGRYVGIIDELILEENFEEKSIDYIVTTMLYSFLRQKDFNIFYLYTIPKNCNNSKYQDGVISRNYSLGLEDLGFKCVNSKGWIYRNQLWDNNYEELNEQIKENEIYFP